ncbi:dynein intermediate chain at 61B [Haematobia irritans]|uniref:dynein intermediate chain at 61B n=1 Tax=Haematobia irritans TaxID=7368 RepID=UPI003F50C78E
MSTTSSKDVQDDTNTNKVVAMAKKKMTFMDKRPSIGISHKPLFDIIDAEIQRSLEARKNFKIHEKIGNELIDVTPKSIGVSYNTDSYKKLAEKVHAIKLMRGDILGDRRGTASSLMKTRSSRGVGFRLSMEDIIAGIGSARMLIGDVEEPTAISPYIDISSSTESSIQEIAAVMPRHRLPFIRVVLRKTELILLYEQQGVTSIKNTEDGNYAEEDNKIYDYLTIGRGKVRRRSDGETQTPQTLYKSRKSNTIVKEIKNTASYVSYFEMYDTYRNLGEKDTLPERSELPSVNKYMSKEDQISAIGKLPTFHWATTVMGRLLAGNNFAMTQRRYRNMDPVKATVDKIDYKYSLKSLFTISPFAPDNERRAVADMCFCYSNNDILAVAYGIYSYQAAKLPETGEVCVWSIKNPCDPERYYFYNYPVVSVEFSPYMPNLLAIGLFDGSVEVRDITKYNEPPIAISQRTTSPSVEPILAIKWIKQASQSDDNTEIDPFLSLSQDGSVTRFHIIKSPFLLGLKQMVLERVAGKPEGLPIGKISDDDISQEANPHPHCLNLTKHPLHMDIYYILTDEGCIHKCSTNYQHHYLEVLKTHKGSVNCMDFSPWSPKLFLTCGNDWFIRIWMEGIFKPLITLQNMYGPYQWAGWSRTHSTVIVALNRKHCEIWDLKRSTLKPVSIHPLESSYNTLALFSRDGNSIAIGNERGKVFLLGFEDMPFPPHYQYDTLEKAIMNAVENFPQLLIEVKSLGYFGYPNKGFVMPP